MAECDDFLLFLKAKEICVENLKSMQSSLIQCADDKQVDMEDSLYQRTIVELDGAPAMESWEELEQLIDQSKILERDIDAWLSYHDLTSYSLAWPTKSS